MATLMALLQDVEDGDHLPRVRKIETMDPPLRRRRILAYEWNVSVWEDRYLKEVVDGFQSRMDSMVTVCERLLTIKARLDSKLQAEREVRQLESWMSSHKAEAEAYIVFKVYEWVHFHFSSSLDEKIVIYLKGKGAILLEWLRSFEDVLTRLLATEEGEEDFQRKNRDEEARLVYAVAVSAVAVLALVYLYLVGVIDRGGTKTYSPGSRVLSSNFVSIVLVLAFYVWFKSRDPAPRRGYRRRGHNKVEARYKPPGASGNFSLGLCADDEEAGIKKEIAAYYYDKHSRWLDVKDREHRFEIPLTPSAPANLDTVEKRRWVKTRVLQVYEVYKCFRAGLPNPHVHQVGHDPALAFSPDFRVEDMLQDLPDNLEAMLDFPHCSAAETQPVRDNHVLEAVITGPVVPNGCFGYEPGTSWVSAVNNDVHGIHSEVGVGGLANGGAANDIPQSSSCEVPSTLSPSRESPTNFKVFQQHSAPMAGLSNKDQHQNSVLDLPPLALKLVSCLVQQIEEKDRQNEEQARVIAELKREVEHLRSILQH